jgi:hypothetical protein
LPDHLALDRQLRRIGREWRQPDWGCSLLNLPCRHSLLQLLAATGCSNCSLQLMDETAGRH